MYYIFLQIQDIHFIYFLRHRQRRILFSNFLILNIFICLNNVFKIEIVYYLHTQQFR